MPIVQPLHFAMFLCCISFFISSSVRADEGERFLSIRCNEKTKIFEVEPRIIWNEELAALSAEINKTNGNFKKRDTQLIQFSLNPPAQQPTGNLEAKCTISGVHLKMSVHGWDFPKLELFSGNNLIAAMTIGNVWAFAGDVFKVRYTPPKGWEELCGDDEAANSWHALNRNRLDTNCPAPVKHSKQ